jgi:ribosomal protein S18 acetylase RimI-like enzyme
MFMDVQLTVSRDVELLIPILQEADEVTSRIERVLTENQNTAYIMVVNGTTIGAAVMHWQPEDSELVYIAIGAAFQGRGYGKAAISWVIDEARQRGVKSILVGTANSSIGNIAFYQKCGFRMNSVRKDYFDYFPAPIYEDGIQIQDMLVFTLQV